MPTGDISQLVRAAWEEALGKRVEDETDDFFEIGGQSLKATRVIASLRRSTGAKIPLRLIFDAPTFDGFTASVSAFLAGADAGSMS